MSVFQTAIPTPASSEPTLQLLSPDGTRTPHDELDAALAHLDFDDLRGFYRDMVIVRAADHEATSLQRQGQLGLWASAVGQEAAQIGAGHAGSSRGSFSRYGAESTIAAGTRASS